MMLCVALGKGHRIWMSLVLGQHVFGIGRHADLMAWGLQTADRAGQRGGDAIYTVFGPFAHILNIVPTMDYAAAAEARGRLPRPWRGRGARR